MQPTPNDCNQSTKKISKVHEALAKIDKVLTSLEYEVYEKLPSTFQSVLSPDAPAECSKDLVAADSDLCSEVTLSLLAFNNRIFRLKNQVSNICDRADT